MPKKRHSRKKRPSHRAWPAVLVVLLILLLVGAGAALVAWPRRTASDIVVRVLFAETAGCSPEERRLVAGVMQNRVNHPGFGRLPTVQAVVEQPGAFACIGDSQNANWARSANPAALKPSERAAWDDCVAVARGGMPGVNGPSGRPLVYYHDKSITKPRNWDNVAWRAVLERETRHFVFYSVVPALNTK